jgi:hypothetical protein
MPNTGGYTYAPNAWQGNSTLESGFSRRFLMSEMSREYATKHFKNLSAKGLLLKGPDHTLVYDADTGAPMDFAISNQPIGQYIGAGVTHWTHICMECIEKFNVDINQTDVITTNYTDQGQSSESPPCGVEWCENKSSHFYDFRGEGNAFVAAVRRVNSKQPIRKDG